MESLVFSLVCWDDDWSLVAFSFCSACVAMGWSLVTREG